MRGQGISGIAVIIYNHVNMSDTFHQFLKKTINDYIEAAEASFNERVESWKIDIFEKESNEVVGGLLARQLSLALSVARNPSVWTAHILPIVLRCMADVYITFCWITKDIKPRARKFIEYGLGQEKLAIEKYREALAEETDQDPNAVASIEAREKMLDSERYRFLIPVNLGAWSEMDTRKMAIEVGEKQFYDFVFTQFSASVHSTWQHIWRFNLRGCYNPLHMGHRVPFASNLAPEPHLFANSAKYLCKTFAKFDVAVMGATLDRDAYKSYNLLVKRFSDYWGAKKKEGGKPSPRVGRRKGKSEKLESTKPVRKNRK
jgi:hypothetical protein